MLHNGFESFSTIHNEVFGPGRLYIAKRNSETMVSWQLYNNKPHWLLKITMQKLFFWFYTGLDAINISSLLSSVIVTVCAESVGGSSEAGWVLELQENPILDLILRKGGRKSKRERVGAQNCDLNYWKGHCWTILIILWCRIWQLLMQTTEIWSEKWAALYQTSTKTFILTWHKPSTFPRTMLYMYNLCD